MKLFTQKEVNKIFNHIPSKTLRWWGMRDLYGWANQINDGRGIHREYELDHLYQIGIVEELSSLNIPVEAINRIMRKHFLYGMVMQSLCEDLERDELGGGSLVWADVDIDQLGDGLRVNVADQMNKMLVITKTLSGRYKHTREIPPKYAAFLIDGTEPKIINGSDELLLDSVMILINLKRIKNFVDHLIREFNGQGIEIPADI